MKLFKIDSLLSNVIFELQLIICSVCGKQRHNETIYTDYSTVIITSLGGAIKSVIEDARPWMARASRYRLDKVARQRTLYMFAGNGFDG